MHDENAIQVKIQKSTFKILGIILLVALLSMFGTDIHLASLPHIAAYMHTDKQHMQQSISSFLFGMGLSILIYGPLSDKYGRKPIIIFGLLIAAISSFMLANCSSITPFLYWRFIQGIGLGVGGGIGRTVFADLLKGEALAIIGSYFSTGMSMSPLFAPVIGGYLQHLFGWQSNFILLGILSTILLIAVSCCCPETNLHKNQYLSIKHMGKNVFELLHHPRFVCATLITGIGMAIIMIYATVSPFIFQHEFDLTAITYGWLSMIAGSGILFGKLVGPSIIKRVTSLKTIYIGLNIITYAGVGLSIIVLSHITSISLIILGVLIAYFGQGLVMPSTSAQALSSFHDKRGAAGALYGSFQLLLASVGSSIVALLPYHGTNLLAYAYLLLGIFGLLAYHYLKAYGHPPLPASRLQK